MKCFQVYWSTGHFLGNMDSLNVFARGGNFLKSLYPRERLQYYFSQKDFIREKLMCVIVLYVKEIGEFT